MINEPLENAKEIASITGSIMREKPEPDDESRLILTEQRVFLKNIETGEESNSIPLNEVDEDSIKKVRCYKLGGYSENVPYSECECYWIEIRSISPMENILSLDVDKEREEAENFLTILREERTQFLGKQRNS